MPIAAINLGGPHVIYKIKYHANLGIADSGI
jgi:hypothetical protein